MSYTWIPAGYGTRGKVTIYIRYKDVMTNDFYCNTEYQDVTVSQLKLGFRSFSRVTVELPDRTLIIVNKEKYRLMDNEFDHAIDIDLYGNNSDAVSVPCSLISAHNGIEGNIHSIDRRKDHRIFGDSGGAQLRFGTQPFVDPYKVIDFFNEVVDVGVSLDVAPRPSDYSFKKATKAAAFIQNRNNEIFDKYARKDLHLLNVVHGAELDKKLEWAKQVEHPRFTGWAVGSTELDLVLRAMDLTSLFSKLQGDHYHFFGVGGPTNIPVLAWLGKYANNFTSDSTTYLIYGNYHKYFSFKPDGSISLVSLGNKSVLPKNKLGLLECNCSVCSAFKYVEAFNLSSSIINDLLTYHNAIALSRYSSYWGRLARNSDLHTYLYYLRKSQLLPNNRVSSHYHDMETAVKAVDTTLWEGFDKAKLLYGSTRGAKYVIKSKSTFSGVSFVATYDKDEDDLIDDEEVVGSKLDSFGHMWSAQADIMPRYLTDDEMKFLGLDARKCPGYEDWKETEEYKLKKNNLEPSNIWIASLLRKYREEHVLPIEIKDEDIVYELRVPILTEHWLYPLSEKDVEVMLEEVRLAIERVKNKAVHKQHKIDAKKLKVSG